ncbi:MAG TPA: cupredoxin domain-containing protein [Candidatus Thermoplasmatota archaeon]|nr:cupredoxin domain-containing protein [Candidatus Thermoplasmatota archaeon]
MTFRAILATLVLAALLATPAAEAAEPRKVFVYLHEFPNALHIAPESIEVERGSEVTLVVANVETNKRTHDFAIEGLGHSTGDLAPGQTATLTFVADKAGTFEYRSTKAGEREAGMRGELVVAGEPEPARTPAGGVAWALLAFAAIALARGRER